MFALFETTRSRLNLHIQFDLEGANLTGGSGGLAESNGFDIYASGNTTLGFSLDGNLIPAASNGILTILDGSIIGDVCLPFVQDVGPEDDTPIFSDAEGNALGENEIGDGSCDSMFNEDNQIIFSLFSQRGDLHVVIPTIFGFVFRNGTPPEREFVLPVGHLTHSPF